MTELPLLSLLNRIASSSSIDEAWGQATAHFASLGFGRINYGFTRFRHLKTIGDPDDALHSVHDALRFVAASSRISVLKR